MKITKSNLRILDVAAAESTRYVINGVQLSRSGDTCRMQATDGRRALRVSWEDDGSGPDGTVAKRDFECIIGKSDLSSVVKLLNGTTAVAYLDESQITDAADGLVPFRQNNGGGHYGNQLSVGKVDGNFPKVDDVIPDRADLDCVRLNFSPALMASTLKAISAMTDEESKGCTLDISMDSNGAAQSIGLTCKGADGRDIRGAIMPVRMDGEPDDARKLYGLLRKFAKQVLTDGLYITETHDDATINTLKSMLGVSIPDSGDGGSDGE